MNKFGTISRGIKAPLVKNGDDIVNIVVNSVLEATKDVHYSALDADVKTNYDLNDGDIIGITESIVARCQGNYVTIDEIAQEIKKLYGEDAVIDVIEPIYSRNRFAMILKGIARGAKKLRILMPLIDEVGNVSINHPFTKMNYEEYYATICANENCDIEIHRTPNYIEHKTDLNLLLCPLHEMMEETLKALAPYINNTILNCYSLKDIFKDKCEYGLLGSNKATEEKLKLFPRKADWYWHPDGDYIMGSDSIVKEIQRQIKDKTGVNVHVVVYADGCFKDPVGGIWEFADPVSMVSYTEPELFESTPNEIKLKAFIDDYKGDNLSEHIKNEIESKKNLMGKMDSQGTTPRLIRDLVASLMDLTSGSGDKGTPIVLVQNYFKNYSND